MRLLLNLNQYYDGLDDYQVNQLFGLFMNMRSVEEAIAEGLRDGFPQEKPVFQLVQTKVINYCKEIDALMESMDKKPIFYINKQLEKCNNDYSKIDIQSIINKYEYLMEERQFSH
ncbi:MAG: hypothetical protein LUG46_09220 [Erysipelotrichaceae bacterium]|nr:hypothetical protein [Erysipelotrichaceae bacterium]